MRLQVAMWNISSDHCTSVPVKGAQQPPLFLLTHFFNHTDQTKPFPVATPHFFFTLHNPKYQ